jgi:pectin methylesterase-like acyl-CoA thioesterase
LEKLQADPGIDLEESQMKTGRLFTPLLFGLGLTLALLWAFESQSTPGVAAPQVSIAAELHVCPSGCAYSSVQAAVDAASDGDGVKVAGGVYTDVSVRPRDDITATGPMLT